MTAIAKKALVGLVQLQVALALLLFLPAGTIRWWQAWLYWMVFLGCTLVITVYFLRRDPDLVARRSVAGPVAEHRRWQKAVQGVAAGAFVALHVVPGLDRRLGWTSVSASMSLLADLGVAAGFAFVFWVLRENTHASSTVTVTEGQRVVSTGPYAMVRHPMYAGAIILLAVTPLALGSLAGLLVLPLLVGVLVARILDEERLLTEQLQGYRDYCGVVRWRLVPFIW